MFPQMFSGGCLARCVGAASIGLVGYLVMLVFPRVAVAQTAPVATLCGTVFDSLFTSRPLAGAEVFLDGTPRSAVTDSLGRFVIDGPTPGTYEIGVGHATFDSIGFASVRRRVMLDEGETTVQLGPPSDRTLYRDACGAASDGEDVGLLMGGVRRTGVDAPVRGAAVIAEWTVSTLALGTKDALEARPATASARADATGRCRLCGVPTDVAVVVRAAADSAVSGAARVDLRGRFFAVQQLDVAAPRRPAHVRGRSACASVPPGRPIGPRGDRMPMVYAVRTATEARRRAAGRPPTASRPARGRRSRRMFFGYSTEPN